MRSSDERERESMHMSVEHKFSFKKFSNNLLLRIALRIIQLLLWDNPTTRNHAMKLNMCGFGILPKKCVRITFSKSG